MHGMLQQNNPNDFVIATGIARSVIDFIEISFDEVGLKYKDYLAVDKPFFQTDKIDLIKGDPTKAKEKLKWPPQVSFDELGRMMVGRDFEYLLEP
jgi:GDPmannose 4,6-dehydratase